MALKPCGTLFLSDNIDKTPTLKLCWVAEITLSVAPVSTRTGSVLESTMHETCNSTLPFATGCILELACFCLFDMSSFMPGWTVLWFVDPFGVPEHSTLTFGAMSEISISYNITWKAIYPIQKMSHFLFLRVGWITRTPLPRPLPIHCTIPCPLFWRTWFPPIPSP